MDVCLVVGATRQMSQMGFGSVGGFWGASFSEGVVVSEGLFSWASDMRLV